MPLVDVTAAPTLQTIGGKTFRVGPLSMYDTGILQRYINEAAKSPYAVAKAEVEALEVPESEREEWLAEPRKASRGWKPPEIGTSPEWIGELLGNYEGKLCFLYVTLSANQPDFTMDDAEALAKLIDEKMLSKLFFIAMDIDVNAGEENESGPKGLSPETSTEKSAQTSLKPTESSPTPTAD